MDPAVAFLKIAELVRKSSNAVRTWHDLLETTQEQSNSKLRNLDLVSDIQSIKEQLLAVWSMEPPPSDISFLYFGLFDTYDRNPRKARVGFYVAGGTGGDPEEQLRTAELSYMPTGRFLKSTVLDSIKQVASANPTKREMLEYALTFGAAGLIAKYAVAASGLSLSVLVGFDSGDFAAVTG